MAKSFFYDNIDLLNATVEDGTISGTTFTASESLTNEENFTDQNITTTGTSIGLGDSLRYTLSSAAQAEICMFYYTGGNVNTFQLYGSNSATTSLTSIATMDGDVGSSGSGWILTDFSTDSDVDSFSYYFFDALAAHGNLAEILLGKQLAFDVEPDIGIVEGKEYFVDMAESYSGLQYATQRTSGIRTWKFNWGNISNTFKNNLETMRNSLDGSFSKFIYSESGTTGPFHWVRMTEDSLQFTEVAYQRWSSSIKLSEQKN